MKLLSTVLLFLLLSFTPLKESKTEKAGLKMQKFVINISNYARSFDSDFIIIPQNGPELVFNKLNSDLGLNIPYMNAIDGIGIEELYSDKTMLPDSYRLNLLKKIKDNKKVIVSDITTNDGDLALVIKKNKSEGFISFPRTIVNEFYKEIPDYITDENTNDINTLSKAKNFLYLINSSNFKTKPIFISSISATNYDVVAIDLFYDDVPLSFEDIKKLQVKANGGKRLVIAYMNIGAAENWRYYWYGNWILNDPVWIKKTYAGYEDEFYVQFWHPEWQNIIYGNDNSYLKKIIAAGFDGVYLDNVEAYYFLNNK